MEERFFRSAENCDTNELKRLLKNGVSIDCKKSDGSSALHIATDKGSKDLVQFLLGQNANVNSADNDGYTPMHIAAMNGFKDLILLFLDNSGKVNVKTKYGWTALHYAADRGNLEITKLLLNRQGDIDATNNKNETAEDRARVQNHFDILEIFKVARIIAEEIAAPPSPKSDEQPQTDNSTTVEEQKAVADTSAQGRWQRCRADFQASEEAKDKVTPSEAIDTLMQMTGLESVKKSFVGQYEQILIAAEQGCAGSASYNLRCDGNPGTGKTTVARLYASFLQEMGVLPRSSGLEETTGSKLINDGVRGLTQRLESMQEKGGGVVFLDEAYQLNPSVNREGGQVLDFILGHAERLEGKYGKLVWVFAGYKTHMEKLFEHNPGLPSRFPLTMTFEDYSDAELQSILEALMGRGGRDVVEKKDTSTEKPPATRPTTLSMPGSSSRAAQVDEWGNQWTWDQGNSTWMDEYDNITGYGVTNLGTLRNPLVSRATNTMWIFDRARGLWANLHDPSTSQPQYPGKPPPSLSASSTTSAFYASDQKWVRVTARRLGRERGKVGFGNARAVRTVFDSARRRQAQRITDMRREGQTPDIWEFVRDDLLGPKAERHTIEACAAWKELEEMEGLEQVKRSVRQLIQLSITNAALEDDEKPLRDISLNRVFLGNPGTGKTTVASLYGKILCSLGLLSKGEVVIKNPSDFIGDVVGSAQTKTRAILANAEGCVLVIDEAYSLDPGSGGQIDKFKSDVIDTIVEQVQNKPGEDRAVVMLGYRDKMEALMKNANEGLSRRFQLENSFEFQDYDDSALLRILLKKCAKASLTIDSETASFAITQLATARAMPNFGNAGAIDNLLSQAKLNMQGRVGDGVSDELVKGDFCVGGVLVPPGGEEAIFADLVGCDSMLEKLEEYRATIELCKSTGVDPKDNLEWNFLFVGAPGTGKTTVARKLGKMFHALKLLPMEEVVEIKAADLVTGYVSQAAIKTTDVLRSARGKVLFIDEAYQLDPRKGGSFMQEVVDTIVQELTSIELKNQLVVVLAGYEEDIDQLMRVNQGLRSRFSEKVRFESFTPEVTRDLVLQNLSKKNLSLQPGLESCLLEVATQLTRLPGYANGRDVETLSKRVFKAFASRRSRSKSGGTLVLAEDLKHALHSLMADREQHTRSANPPPVEPTQQSLHFSAQHSIPPPAASPSLVSTDTKTTAAVPSAEMIENGGKEKSAGFLAQLQQILDARGLNSKEGVEKLATMTPYDGEMVALAAELATSLDINASTARDMLSDWQSKQASVRDEVKKQEQEVELAKKEKRKALVPIWRCGVCGRADQPFIVCYVSPYIVRYEER